MAGGDCTRVAWSAACVRSEEDLWVFELAKISLGFLFDVFPYFPSWRVRLSDKWRRKVWRRSDSLRPDAACPATAATGHETAAAGDKAATPAEEAAANFDLFDSNQLH